MKKLPLFLALAVVCPALQAAPAKAPQKAAPKSKSTKPSAPQWKTATPAQRQAVAIVIRAQLDAFKKNDWEKAATYQSEGLRRSFGSTARFRLVIQGNYPQFAHYASVGFGYARTLSGGSVIQMAVRVKGADGVQLRAIYSMVKEKSGYKVAGVQGGSVMPGADSGSYV